MMKQQVNIRKLSTWREYLIAVLVTSVIVAVAWFVGRDQPTPAWISNYLIPGLGWLGLILIIIVIFDWIRKRL